MYNIFLVMIDHISVCGIFIIINFLFDNLRTVVYYDVVYLYERLYTVWYYYDCIMMYESWFFFFSTVRYCLHRRAKHISRHVQFYARVRISFTAVFRNALTLRGITVKPEKFPLTDVCVPRPRTRIYISHIHMIYIYIGYIAYPGRTPPCLTRIIIIIILFNYYYY